MTNDNIDISNELALMSKLEDFLFSQIRTSFTSQVRFEPSILQAQSNQELKKAIFELHDDGKLKETDESRKQRMGTAFLIQDSVMKQGTSFKLRKV